MAYFGNYNAPQMSSVQQVYQSYPPTTGLASYGGASAYRVPTQPNYYTGQSFSTTSDNDNYGLPVAGYGNSGYNTGYQTYGANISSYGGQNYATDSYGYAQQGDYTQTYPRTEEMTPQIEAAYEAATTQRRQPVIKRQVITVPGAPGKVQQIVRRLPTPTPDIVERVFVVKPQRDVVNLVIERPGTPPAQYKDRTIIGKPRKPLINPLVVRVASRSYPASNYYQQQQYVQALPAPTSGGQTSSYNYQQAQPTTSQTQQPTMSSQQYQQAGLSQTRLSQASQTQLNQPRQSFVVAPVQYDESQQQQQQPSVSQQQQALSGQYNYSVAYPAQQQQQQIGYGTTGYAANYQTQGYGSYPTSPYQYNMAY
ncbi:unnamed protein product [Brachionus calyciflorus]|uniref:Uncharacterized protein n=1 Tax=Brachionus calyciflorus TaxID=104777 RepID=A0A813MD62_9BILA|nr:unnamed protein product [Brachionus calyciflorus]